MQLNSNSEEIEEICVHYVLLVAELQIVLFGSTSRYSGSNLVPHNKRNLDRLTNCPGDVGRGWKRQGESW